MIIHLVQRMILSPLEPVRIKCSRDHKTSACPVIIGYQPMVRKKTASHRRLPVPVITKNFSKKPSAYGMMPRPDSGEDVAVECRMESPMNDEL